MNALQDKLATEAIDPPMAATRPFTRVPNVICDEIKPAMRKHKVDRSVLDAIIRLLEGFHRSFVVVTIAELATRAGVSQSSVSAALARLEANGLITRHRKLLRDRSRFVWCLALTEKYRVVAGMGTVPGTPTKFHAPAIADCHGAISPEQPKLAKPPAPANILAVPAASPPPPAQPAEEPQPPAAPSPGPSAVSEPVEKIPEVSAPPRIPANKPARPELTAEEKTSLEALREVGIDYWMARKLARAHSPELIHQALQNLRHRAGTVRNPAAWIVREIERGGYTNPAVAQEERLKNDRAAREALERDRKRRSARARSKQARLSSPATVSWSRRGSVSSSSWRAPSWLESARAWPRPPPTWRRRDLSAASCSSCWSSPQISGTFRRPPRRRPRSLRGSRADGLSTRPVAFFWSAFGNSIRIVSVSWSNGHGPNCAESAPG